MRPSLSSRISMLSLLAATLFSMSAAASPDDEKAACVAAVDSAQLARYEGKLRAARAGFVACTRDTCPAPIRSDCARWLAEVEASLPSLVLAAKWADGRDARGVRATVDGEPLTGFDEGRAVAVDPGDHTFRFEADGARPVEMQLLVREGEKNRLIEVRLAAADGASSSIPPAARPAGAAEPSAGARGRQVPVGAYVAGGVGLLGLASFAFFGLSGTSKLDDLRASCKPTCSQADVTAARTELLVGDVSLAVGVIALGVASWLFLRPTAPDRAAAAGTNVRVDVRGTANGGSASLEARF